MSQLEGCTRHSVDERHSEFCDNYPELLSKIDHSSSADYRIINTHEGQEA
jgi:hypothetical protein